MKNLMMMAPSVMALAAHASEPRGLISVRADASPAGMIKELNTAFADFKATVDQREKDRDVLLQEKEEKLNDAMSSMQNALDRLATDFDALKLGGNSALHAGEVLSEEEQAHADTFDAYFRSGIGSERDVHNAARAAGGRLAKIQAAVEVGTDVKGGVLAPIEWDRQVTDKLVEVSPMRQLAAVQSVSGQGFTHIFNLRGTSSGWVGETSDRDETNTATLKPYTFSFGEIYANPATTQRALDDVEADLAAWLGGEVETEFAYQEGVAFISGNGTNKPRGILTYDSTTETALDAALRHPLGPVSEVISGHASQVQLDGLIDLVTDLPEERSMGATVYNNRKTSAVIRKLKDSDGQLIWRPSVEAGKPATLLGVPHRELTGLPDVAANAVPILYGNINRAYRIFDRTGVRVLRDPYTNKPYVHFYTTKRVGGGMWNPEYLRYHRIKAPA